MFFKQTIQKYKSIKLKQVVDGLWVADEVAIKQYYTANIQRPHSLTNYKKQFQELEDRRFRAAVKREIERIEEEKRQETIRKQREFLEYKRNLVERLDRLEASQNSIFNKIKKWWTG